MFLIRDVIACNGALCSCCQRPLKKGEVVVKDWMKHVGTYIYCRRCLKNGAFEVKRQTRSVVHSK